jgi:hypothetical protein
MKTILAIVVAGATLASMTGCIVVPAHERYEGGGGGYVAPAGVVYVAPAYASPGPGWGWEYHARYGWGWHHPQRGWHRGWN